MATWQLKCVLKQKLFQVGGDATVLVPAYGSPFAFDLDNGRRYAR